VVYVAETMNEVEVLQRAGTPAACARYTVEGGRWLKDYTEQLQDFHVVIVTSSGYPHTGGLSWGLAVGKALWGRVLSVKVIGAPPNVDGRPSDIGSYLLSGKTVPDLIRWITEQPGHEIPQRTNGKVPEGAYRGIMLASELQAAKLPKVRWVVPGLLPEGAYILAGRPKIGKSWLGLAAAYGVACEGGQVLEREVGSPGTTLYVALEDNLRRLKDRIGQMAPEGEWPEDKHLLTPDEHGPRDSLVRRMVEGGPEGVRALDGWCRKKAEEGRPVKLIVIDTLGRWRRSPKVGASVYHEDVEAIAPLQQLAMRHHAVVFLVEHQRKAEAEDIFDTISGSLGKTGTVDGIWVLTRERGQHYGKLWVTGRDVDEAEMQLSFDQTRGMWGPAHLDPLAALTVTQRKVVRALQPEGTVRSTQEVALATGIQWEAVRKVLRRLKAMGMAHPEARGRWGLGDDNSQMDIDDDVPDVPHVPHVPHVPDGVGSGTSGTSGTSDAQVGVDNLGPEVEVGVSEEGSGAAAGMKLAASGKPGTFPTFPISHKGEVVLVCPSCGKLWPGAYLNRCSDCGWEGSPVEAEVPAATTDDTEGGDA
jgi:hypothetical protein